MSASPDHPEVEDQFTDPAEPFGILPPTSLCDPAALEPRRRMSVAKYLPSYRLRSLLLALLMVAPTLALIAQHQKATQRERSLKARLAEARRKYAGEKGMRDFLGDLAIVILNDATTVEELQIDNPDAGTNYTGTPTGRVFGKPFVTRLTRALLDASNYGYYNADDMPDAEMAFRFRRGRDSLDIFLDASHPGHQDLWITSRNAVTGKMFRNGWLCLDDARLDEVRKDWLSR